VTAFAVNPSVTDINKLRSFTMCPISVSVFHFKLDELGNSILKRKKVSSIMERMKLMMEKKEQ